MVYTTFKISKIIKISLKKKQQTTLSQPKCLGSYRGKEKVNSRLWDSRQWACLEVKRVRGYIRKTVQIHEH